MSHYKASELIAALEQGKTLGAIDQILPVRIQANPNPHGLIYEIIYERSHAFYQRDDVDIDELLVSILINPECWTIED